MYVLGLVNPFLHRMSAQEILEHSFLAVEPEVVLLATDASKKQLTLQVVFKGMDRLSVKFEFNGDTDTAEEVVNEMVRQQKLTPLQQVYDCSHLTKHSLSLSSHRLKNRSFLTDINS
jgi:WNK lysine deficient protein kinase